MPNLVVLSVFNMKMIGLTLNCTATVEVRWYCKFYSLAHCPPQWYSVVHWSTAFLHLHKLPSASLLAAASEKLPACFCCLREGSPADVPVSVTLHPSPFARGRELCSNNHHLASSQLGRQFSWCAVWGLLELAGEHLLLDPSGWRAAYVHRWHARG